MPTLTAGDLAERLGARLIGQGWVCVSRVAPLERAQAGDVAFIAKPQYAAAAQTTGASVLLLPETLAEAPVSLQVAARLICADPYLAYARVAQWLYPDPPLRAGVHPSAVVEGYVDPSAEIGPRVLVGEAAVIRAGCRIEAGAVIGARAVVGEGSWIGPNVTIGADCVIGRHCRVHAGAVIGADGFGFAWDSGAQRWEKIPQVGRVIIGDAVEIGANTTIDRGALDDTVIEDGVKIDNLVQIAHNCRIGAHTAIAGCVGIAGSTTIGRRCRIGGAAGIAGHLRLADDVTIGAAAVVMHDIEAPGLYTGYVPTQPFAEWRRNAAWWRRLAELGEWARAQGFRPKRRDRD